MNKTIRDYLPLLARDILGAFGLLTRIPVPFTAPRAAGAWAWPVVGLCVSAVAVTAGIIASGLGVGSGSIAALVLAVQAALTGALHEDGLADCADGFFGGRDKARRLEIMKDSHIGSFGALALILGVLARWSALTALVAVDRWEFVLAAGAMSRAPMAVLMTVLPNARGSGLSASVGAPPAWAAGVAVALSLGLALLLAGPTGLAMALAVALVCLGLAVVAKAKIGGQTGDVLGAGQQLAEIIGLVIATSALQ